MWVDPRWKFGQFSNPDPKLRREAVDLAKRTTDIAQHMEAEIMVYWPAQDGYVRECFQTSDAINISQLMRNVGRIIADQTVLISYKELSFVNSREMFKRGYTVVAFNFVALSLWISILQARLKPHFQG